MNNQKLNSIGLLAIFLVIAIPTVYGAVEPSIIINMESGQSEKPIQVKNSGGTIVFSVDTDGTVFPSVAGGISGVFGTEIVVIDNSGNTGGSSASESDGSLNEVTLPTTAPQYRITAVEVKVASTTDSDGRICIAIMDLVNENEYPINPLFYHTIVVLTSWSLNPYINDVEPVLTTDTVYKIPIAPIILDGGDTFIVAIAECDGGTDISFETATSGVSVPTLRIDQIYTAIIEQNHDLESPVKFHSLKTGTSWENESETPSGFQRYLKVFAEPLQ